VKKSGLRKLLIGTGISTLAVFVGAGLLLLVVIGMYTTVLAAVVNQEEAVRACAGEPMGDGSIYAVLDQALSYIGTPYEHGGASYSSIDCSGLALVAYRDAGTGITLTHATWEQVLYGESIYQSGTGDYFVLRRASDPDSQNAPILGENVLYVYSDNVGIDIPILPGDLIFFSYGGAVAEGYSTGHVGIYIGNGQYVHALNPTMRTHISPLFTGSETYFNPPRSIYAIRRYLGSASLSAFVELVGASDLKGYPITITYQDAQLLAQYIQSNTATMTAVDRYREAVNIINQARLSQTSITSVINGLGGTESCVPDAESWRIVRCALLGFYVDPH